MIKTPESRRPTDDTAGVMASLRKSLADKDAALQRTSYAAIRVEKQLEDALKQNEILRKQLKLGQQGRPPAALVKAPNGAPRSRVALRQHEAAALKLARVAAERSKRKRFRLAGTAVSIAVLILIWGVWSQLPESTTPRPVKAELPKPAPVLAQREVPATPVPDSKPAPSSRVRFEASLSRLNRALLYAPSGSPEQVLRTIRQNGAEGWSGGKTPPVCDFSWNYGQPALLYHAGIPLDVALNQCAAAVESYVFPKITKAPANYGRGG
jgi:hypothetical protein